MDPDLRRRYDAALLDGARAPAAEPPSPEPARPEGPPRPAAAPRRADEPAAPVPESLRQAQATLSQFVRKATLGRLREGIEAEFGGVEAAPAGAFDEAFSLGVRRGLFQRGDPPVLLLVRMVTAVDGAAVADAWSGGLRALSDERPTCVLLLGQSLASQRELAAAISEQRRRSRRAGPVLVPVDTRDWQALLPPDTPSPVRRLLGRLKQAS
jgi:hypothetical protein